MQPAQCILPCGRRRGRHQFQVRDGHRLIPRRIGRGSLVRLLWPGRGKRQDDQQKIVKMAKQIPEGKNAVSLHRLHIALGQQTGEPSPAKAASGIGQNVRRAIDKDQAGAHHQTQIGVTGRLFLGSQFNCFTSFLLRFDHLRTRLVRRIAQRDIGAHHASHAVPVSNTDGAKPQFNRPADKIGRMGSAVQEAVIGHGAQLGEGRPFP